MSSIFSKKYFLSSGVCLCLFLGFIGKYYLPPSVKKSIKQIRHLPGLWEEAFSTSQIVDLKGKKVFYVVAMPKSASTYFYNSLAKVLNGKPACYHLCGNNQQKVTVDALKEWSFYLSNEGFDYVVSTSHLLPDDDQIAIFKKNNIPVVFLTRKLPDVVVSLRNFMIESDDKKIEWLLRAPVHQLEFTNAQA